MATWETLSAPANLPSGISTRSVGKPDPIVHLARQDERGKWHTLCNGGLVQLIDGPLSGRPCIRCDAKQLEQSATTPKGSNVPASFTQAQRELHRLAELAQDYLDGLTVAPEPGRVEIERGARIAYAVGVLDTLRWLADDAVDPMSQLIEILGIDD